ncbi:replication initiation protein [Photobacterium aquimaris]|uniref:Replication initiation protein n=1 Tax=Photobacterium aquimaris TaxID=512643 RepID=A0A2T3IEN6_9GAMM|nr:replication initiation protein [Photobacterium aquimaris]OBU16192.1 hypothetical protein AYY20_19785 [Photobacterium aquimaris]PSU23048.1 replication initiation protein [Photobacterium aquimaris]
MTKITIYKTQDLYVTQHNMLARSVSNLSADGQALLMTALALHDYEGDIDQEIFISSSAFLTAIPSYDAKNVGRVMLAAEENINACRIQFNKVDSEQFLTGYTIELGENDTRLVSWTDDCVVRRSKGETGEITGISIRLNAHLKPLLTGILKDGSYTSVKFKNVAAIIGQKKNSISVGAVALYFYLSSWKGVKNIQGGFSVDLALDTLKLITRSEITEYKNYKRFCLVPIVDLINSCTNLSVRYDEIKQGRKVSGIKFGCGSEVIANTKPKRPRLKPKPRASKTPEHLWGWAHHNIKLLLNYRQELKNYNSDLDLTTPDVERLAKYYYCINDHERCDYWSDIFSVRKNKLEQQKLNKLPPTIINAKHTYNKVDAYVFGKSHEDQGSLTKPELQNLQEHLTEATPKESEEDRLRVSSKIGRISTIIDLIEQGAIDLTLMFAND